MFIVLILTSSKSFASKNVSKTVTPSWVNEINLDAINILYDNSDYQYLLFDFQKNLVKQSLYYHYASKILNSKGIQSLSDIEINFDPSYENLQFHILRIIRDGIIIDKLKESTINV